MILRYAGRSTEVATITPQSVREVLTLHDVRRERDAATLQLATESANGPSLALRRLREKVTRLDKRLTRLTDAQLSSAQNNEKGKARARSTVRSNSEADADDAGRSDAKGLGRHNPKTERRAEVERQRARNAATRTRG